MTNLIFDYDGTLHDSIKIYAPAFRLAYQHLVSFGITESKEWTDDEISRWLGFSSRDMWNSFLPDLTQNQKDECSQIIGDTMVRFVHEGKARLYPYAIEVLQTLNEAGYTSVFLSNCKHSYMRSHIKQFHLDNYFAAFYCTEDFNFKPKHEIFNTIKQNFNGEFIVIGDRFQDMEIAQMHGLKSIGCSYGYGEKWELLNSTVVASQVVDIVSLLRFMKE